MHLSTFIVLVLLACAYSKSHGESVSLRPKLRSSPSQDEAEKREGPTVPSERLVETEATNSNGSKPSDSYAGIIDHVREILQAKIEEASVSEDEKSRGSKEDNEEERVEEENATGSSGDKELHPGSLRESEDRLLAEKADFRDTKRGNSSSEKIKVDVEERSTGGIISTGQIDDGERSHSVTVGATIEKIVDVESRNGGAAIEPGEEDLREAANFGLRAMHDLYYVKEPQLYSMGLYLASDNPARYVAAFNDQTEEARALSKYGFAVLQGATMFVRKFPDAPSNLILSRQRQRNPLEQNCPNRGTPDCPQASLRYRTSDGSCNNLENLWWGSAMSTMQRFLPAVYQDGIQTIRRSKTGRPLPSAREISNVIHEDKDVSLASVTHMLMQWGQFVDHDMTATGQSRGFNGTVPQCCLNAAGGFQSPEFMHPECLPIPVGPQDTFYGSLGVRCLEFLRSGSAPRDDCEFGPREQLSQVTSYLDASTVYSSNAFQSDSLRLFRNGLLQYGRIQSRRPLLPRRESDLCKRGSLSTTCFRAGDGRLSEQPALTSLHVVFLRLHNRIATKLAAVNPHWGDEKLFQETRKIVGAIVQHVTYREFLPIILGQEVMNIFDLEVLRKGYYEGYDLTVNPTIANGFSSAAFRFGHSLVQRSFVRFDGHHQPIFNNVSIHDEFSNPVNLETAGSVDRLLLGLVNQPSQRRDEYITEELTNHLFQTPRFPFGMDLASLNIQRGRDHGVPPYVNWRRPCGLSAIRTFDDLSRAMPAAAVRKFRQLYSSVEDIDLFPAGLAEHSVAGGLVGPTFACIIGQQFNNLRRGDRFWYENSGGENSFTPGQLQQIRRVSLAQILCRTMDNIETIQPFVFLTPDTLKNERVRCSDPAVGKFNLEFWAAESLELRGKAQILGKANRKAGSQSKSGNTKPSTKEQASTKINAQNSVDQSKIVGTRPKPVKASIHQQNRIVVKRPLGQPDNVTVVVQNNAVNSPVFVSDAVHGSNLKIQPSAQFQSQSTQNPTFDIIDQRPTYQNSVPPILSVPSLNGPKPIPTSVPVLIGFKAGSPYIPHAYGDPSNPNPLNHGFQLANYPTQGVVFDSFSATSPRPALYTYYTNVQQKPSTERPQYQINDRLDSQKPQLHNRPAGQSYVTPTPSSSSWTNLEPNHGVNDQAAYRPTYGAAVSPQLHNSGGNKPDNWQQLQQDQYRPINAQSDPGAWNSPNHPNRPSVRPTDQQDGTGYWKPEIYQTRPHPQNRPFDQQYGYQERPVVNGPFNHENLDFYQLQPKPPSYNDHVITWTSESYPAGLIKEPNNQHNPENGAAHQIWSDSRPVQADPDGWSTIPSYQKPSASKPSGYQDAGTWTEAPPYQTGSTESPSHSASDGSFFSYQNGPTVKPIIIENKLTNVPTYQTGPVNNFPTQSSWTDASPYKKNPPKQPATNLNKFQEIQNPPSYQKPTVRPFLSNDHSYHSQDDHDDFKNLPVYQTSVRPLPNDNRINVQTYTLGPIKKPVSFQSNSGSSQLSAKPPSRPPTGGLDSLLSNLGYQTSARPDLTNSQSYAVQKTTEGVSTKPSKVHSVSIVTETIETIKQSGYPVDGFGSKVTSEVPSPLFSSTTIIDRPATRRPGQYYYEKNVLHRYPDETVGQIPVQDYYSSERRNAGEQSRNKVTEVESTLDSGVGNSTNTPAKSNKSQNVSVVRNSDDKMTHTPIEANSSGNEGDGVYYDLDEAFSEGAESSTLSSRANHWLNPEVDSGLPSMLEMPKITSGESAVVEELPRPIALRNRAS